MILELKNVSSGYPTRKNALKNVSLYVDEMEIVVVMGHNGAGKTTLINTIFGLLKKHSGVILYKGKELSGIVSSADVGMSYCPQGQGIFPSMSVIENLDLAVLMQHVDSRQYLERLEKVFGLFPVLRARNMQRAGTLSGGEQRMLSLGMAIMQRPSSLLLDEPSLGLSPMLIQSLFEVIKTFNSSFGMSILLVEQNVKSAVELAHRIYILKMGEVIYSGKPDILLERQQLWKKL